MAKGTFWSFILHLHPRYVPEGSARFRFTWCLGGLAFLMFLVETVTGLLLMLHYVPTASGAYLSIQDITHIVPYGLFLRNLHYWCGQAMVVLVVLHMVRVVITGSFGPPRRLNWMIGLTLLTCTLFVDFTGYLIVWDERALWARTIARGLAELVPGFGSGLASLFFGAAPVSDAAIIRLYVWHAVLLPGAAFGLMAWHFWKIRRDGGISAPL